MFSANSTAQLIRAQKEPLATAIAKYQYNQYSQDWSQAKPDHFQKSVRDIGYHLDYLAEAIDAEQTSLFEDYIRWARALFAGLKFPDTVLPQTLESMRAVINDSLPSEVHSLINQYLDAGLAQCNTAPEQPDPYISTHSPLSDSAQAYLEALLAGKRHEAGQLILDAVKEGTSVKRIYLDVFQPSQREIGRLWQINKVSVAEEHYCTAATQLIMSQLYPYIFSTERVGHRLLATSVGGELHEIGIRMVADFFEMEGWDTYFLGANAPTKTILQTIEAQKPDILAISVTITSHVSRLEQLIRSIKEYQMDRPPYIIVGGYPFNVAADLWKKVGADGYGMNAEEAINVSTKLMSAN